MNVVLLAQQTSFQDVTVSPLYYLCVLIFVVVFLAAGWKIFTKAGRPGWAILIPIYNTIVLLDIAGKPWWWILLFFIPLVNIIIAILVYVDLAKAFGRSALFGLGLMFLSPIFFLILGFGDSEYVGAPS
jgi:hypothetical protein